ncbi:uncharacterized protein LOC116177315 [Photinus pyralis]|nr:uncharacterized protein LOC116177315 [Photinus pyralis]
MSSINGECCTLCIFFVVLIHLTVSYKMINIVDYKQCPRLGERNVELETDSFSGLVLTLGTLKDSAWHRDDNFVCKFDVKPFNPSMGMFIVIQSIVFRKNSTGGCIDYIQYRRGDGSTSRQYCGSLTASLGMDRIFAPDVYVSEVAPTVNSFISHFGKVEVTIHISKEPLKAHQEMNLEVVFTQFSSCNMRDYRDCGKQYKNYCIYKDFFNDVYVNCPFPDCTDEGGCDRQITTPPNSMANNVVIGSVTSLFVVFLFFICSLWLCRKYKKFCWDENFANSSNTNRTVETEENEETSNNISLPSTTRDTTLHNINADEDKDLPPAYDTLFPNR